MSRVPDSFLTTDEYLIIKTEDESLRRFLGQNVQDMFVSFPNYLHEDDKPELYRAIEDLKKKGMPKNTAILRVRDEKGDYHWASASIANVTESTNPSDAPIYQIHLSDMEDSQNQYLKDSLDECRKYLNFVDGCFFEYEVDTRQITVFSYNSGQRLTLFSDTLDQFKESMVNGKISKESEATLVELCKDLEKKRATFSYTLNTSFFSVHQTMGQCIVEAQLIEKHGKEKFLGYVKPINMPSDAKQEGYVRDAGLPVLNKSSIIDYAKRAMACEGRKVCLIIFDLDNFKNVNDTLGHMVGDEVLLRSVDIIKNALEDRAIVGRIGGDEMMIVFPDVQSETELRNTMRTIRMDIEWEFQNKWGNLSVTCSMGAAVYPDNAKSYDETFALADKMLYIAKDKGKNRYVIFVPEIHGDSLNPKLKSPKEYMQKLQGNRNGIMQQLVDQFLMRKAMTVEQVLANVASCFGLNEIVLVIGRTFHESKMNIWNHQGYRYNVTDPAYCAPDLKFLESFDENNLLVMDAIVNLENITEKLYQTLKEKGVESAIFYKFANSSDWNGYAIFSKTTRRQKWSEEDKILLSLVGKIIELWNA